MDKIADENARFDLIAQKTLAGGDMANLELFSMSSYLRSMDPEAFKELTFQLITLQNAVEQRLIHPMARLGRLNVSVSGSQFLDWYDPSLQGNGFVVSDRVKGKLQALAPDVHFLDFTWISGKLESGFSELLVDANVELPDQAKETLVTIDCSVCGQFGFLGRLDTITMETLSPPSDIFYLRGLPHVYCTQLIKNLAEENVWSGMTFSECD